MFRTVVGPYGRLEIGDQAVAAGYVPGTLVDVIVASSGSLIVAFSYPEPEVELEQAAFRVRSAARPGPKRTMLAGETR